eukprot:5880579-Amphidinium_carterae.1
MVHMQNSRLAFIPGLLSGVLFGIVEGDEADDYTALYEEPRKLQSTDGQIPPPPKLKSHQTSSISE